jgi:hypothetical protein
MRIPKSVIWSIVGVIVLVLMLCAAYFIQVVMARVFG